MTTHEERIGILREALRTCHEKGWTYDTKAIADRVAPLFSGMGFTSTTVKALVHSTVDLLLVEKKTGKAAPLGA